MLRKIVDKIQSSVQGISTPKVFSDYQTKGYIDSDKISLESVKENLVWFRRCSDLTTEQAEYLQALVQAIESNYPVQAYQLFTLYRYFQPSTSIDFIDLSALEESVLASVKIGVAVITYNRLKRLQGNIKNIHAFSNKNTLVVVADDGSQDGTKDWCDENSVACISHDNAGVVANKNRALYYLHEIEQCDVSILLEDDCRPIEQYWDAKWALTALAWGHVNFAHKRVIDTSKLIKGRGEIYSPFISKAVTGQCTATSLEAFKKVGYLNPIFQGYGCGHVEWTQRFIAQGFNGLTHNDASFPCINIGLLSEDAPTHKSEDDIQRNQALKKSLKSKQGYIYPWQTEQDKAPFIDAINSVFKGKKLNRFSISQARDFSDVELNKNFFFIHIPKTAGTSFRKALEDKFTVLGDYGENTKHTASLIKQVIYQEKSPLALKKQMKSIQNTWISGHVGSIKYSDLVSVRHIVTFVREPVEQVISHFNHAVTHHGFKGTIEQFLKRPSASNFQRNNLKPIPISLIGYVGLTDRYDESLALINGYYCIDLDIKSVNVNRKKTIKKEGISASLKKQIIEQNKQDIECVKEVNFLHKQRIALTQENKQWVYSHFKVNPNNVLIGCAYYSHSEKPVEIEVMLNGEVIETIVADRFYDAFAKVNFPRERYIGIRRSLAKHCKKGDKVEVFAKETGQQLTFKPLVIKK
ncbi:glycosyltransferase [Psychromonas sp. 14N.309.X.WAT.B.A12]|uniref:glycosyltransferase family 2 protein n=1 Tax=Psychromonas sp. 14N.309.X.WAT.B.A12 TaxID=2998322 RepID=UPI0025B0BEA1|nr:glycosyltransferase [Psychromonas sp. 14N.309.X.WAT.B.A12]MDN2664380.1 glycosyltransferase [Psychromonas sp. 14N.309.X.WAT.B.A12]